MAIRLETLGILRLVRDGEEIPCGERGALSCALLAYLALEQGADRGEVVGVFWPDLGAEAAALRLEHVLEELERRVPGVVAEEGSRLVLAQPVEVDALEMCDACREGDAARALALYDTPFLGESPPAVSRAFDDWMAGWAEHLAEMRQRARRRSGRGARVRSVIRRLRSRHVLPWLLGYLGGSLALLEGSQYIVEGLGWQTDPVPTLLVVLAFGLLTTLTLAWFHGAAGWQRVTRTEVALHLVIAAGLVTTLMVYEPPEPPLSTPEAAPPPTVVAVLPITDNTGDRGQAALAAELTERLVQALDRVPALRVLSVAGVGVDASPEAAGSDSVAAERGAGTLTLGTLTALGDSVRLSVRLVDARTRQNLGSWGITRPEEPSPSAALLASQMADSIRLAIGSEVRRRRLEQGATEPAALTLYQRALTIMYDEAAAEWIEERERGVGLLDQADSLAAGAERLDPVWAAPTLLRAKIADVKSRLLGGASSRDLDVLREAIHHATRALDRGADSAAALEVRGSLELTMGLRANVEDADRILSRAETDLRHAVRLDDERSRAWWALSELMDHRGSNEGAYDFAEKAYSTDSFLELAVPVLEQLVETSLDLRRVDEAMRWWEELRRVTPSDQGVHLKHLLILASLTDAELEHVDAALASTDSVVALGLVERRESWSAHGQMMTAIVAASAGLPDSAEALIRRARPVMEAGNEQVRAAAALFEAVARIRMADPDAAIALLRRYVEIVPSGAQSLASDWWFEDLWGDPRFRALYATPTEAATGG